MASLIIVMGVSGTGKSTIGKMLAEQLDLSFYDADDFHPQANIDKMQQGIPLNDEDRKPWLTHLSSQLAAWAPDGAVLACSALKASYRELLSDHGQLPIHWVHLSGSMELISSRMKARANHFMPETLLRSQFEALESPQDAITIDIEPDPEMIISQILRRLPQ